MLSLLVWLVLAWVGGTAAILGSLMTIASFLLWLLPTPYSGRDRLKVLGFSVGVAIVGFALIRIVPFPSLS